MTSPERLTFRGAEGQTLVADARGAPDAAPVLLLHGGGQTRHAWSGTAEALADRGFRTLSLDLRGHGESDRSSVGHYRYSSFAVDLGCVVAEVAKASGHEPALVGASLGGLASMLLAASDTSVPMSALVLVDITPWMRRDGVDRIVGFMQANLEDGFASLDEAAAAIQSYLPHRKRSVRPEGLAKNLVRHDDGRYRWHWDPAFVRGDNAVSTDAAKFHEKMIAGLPELSMPVQLVRGKDSDLIDLEYIERFLALVPHARFDDIAGAGHMVAGDRNDAFTDAVADFLVSVR